MQGLQLLPRQGPQFRRPAVPRRGLLCAGGGCWLPHARVQRGAPEQAQARLRRVGLQPSLQPCALALLSSMVPQRDSQTCHCRRSVHKHKIGTALIGFEHGSLNPGGASIPTYGPAALMHHDAGMQSCALTVACLLPESAAERGYNDTAHGGNPDAPKGALTNGSPAASTGATP